LQHRSEDALSYLKHAVVSEPDNFKAHAFWLTVTNSKATQAATSERNRAEALKRGLKP
jgi:hypothetical protein